MDANRPEYEPLLVFIFIFYDAPLILECHFKFVHVSWKTFLQILRISNKVGQLCTQISNFSVFTVNGSPKIFRIG
jgi:hypothetical protein